MNIDYQINGENMSLYITISLGLLFLCFSSFSIRNEIVNSEGKCISNNSMLYKYISLIVLSFFWYLTAFRSANIGNDTQTYIRAFKNVVQNGINTHTFFEKGYIYFTYLISKFTSDPHLYLIVHASICYLGFAIYIFNKSKNVIVSTTLVFCFCYSLYTNILRQGLAMLICLFAFEVLKKGNKALYIFLVLIASTLHTSALVCLLLLLCNYFPDSPTAIIVSAIIAIVISFSGAIIYLLVNHNIVYSSFAESKYAGTGYLGVTFAVIRAALFIGIHRYALGTKQKIEYGELYLLLILSCLGFSINIFTRLSQYFVLPLITEIPNLFYSKKLEKNKGLLIIICIVLLLYFIIVCLYRPQWNNLYPYKTWNE